MLGNPRNYFFGVGEGGGGGGRNPEYWDLESTDKDLESSTEYLELGIHGVEFQNTRLHWIPCLMGLIECPINHRRKSKTAVITCQLKIKKKKTEPSGWHQAFKENNCVCNHSR